jgi:hypothetical protein
MRRVIVIAAAGMSLAGCSSFSMGDYFKSTPPTVQVQLDSTPQGADARTSLGPGCKTPCSVSVPVPDTGFSVAFTMNKFQPATVPVTVVHNPGDFASSGTANVDPNPVVATLQPIGPPPKPPRKHSVQPRKPKPPSGAAAPPPADDSAFPAPSPGAAPPPPPPPAAH